MTDAVSGNRSSGSAVLAAAEARKRGKQPDPKRFGAATLPIVEKIETGMIAAREQARALEKDLIRQKGAYGHKQLGDMDKLMSTYLLLSGMMAARGDAKGAARLAAQAEKMLARAPEAAANARKALDIDMAEADPGERAQALDKLRSLVNGLSAKLRTLAAQVEQASRLRGDDEDRKTLAEAAKRLKETAEKLEEAIEDKDEEEAPDNVAKLLDTRAAERTDAVLAAHAPVAEPAIVATEV
ncbi:MAG: hypothetical protein H7841_03245 [Magnetospirillum sp. WYHS-4]